jgi:PKD domain
MTKFARTILLVGTALVAVVLVTGCGGGDSNKPVAGDPRPKEPNFHVKATAGPFAGAAPLRIKFRGFSYRAKGDVHYSWHFDDGTVSNVQNPVHTFSRPGYYLVLMDARDDTNNDRWNLFVGAWPKQVWQASRTRPLTKKLAESRTAGQWHRTNQRRGELQARVAKRTENL